MPCRFHGLCLGQLATPGGPRFGASTLSGGSYRLIGESESGGPLDTLSPSASLYGVATPS
jgi:hypothetical protein